MGAIMGPLSILSLFIFALVPSGFDQSAFFQNTIKGPLEKVGNIFVSNSADAATTSAFN
jgi:hypothetical protein